MHFDVAIIGARHDPHIKPVIDHLKAAELSVTCLDQSVLWAQSVSFKPNSHSLVVGNIEITSCSVTWYRRPYPTAIFNMSTADMKFARSEFSHTLFGGISAITERWFTTPESMRRASFKPLQLAWVKQDGRVKSPETLVTSSYEEAKRFLTMQPNGCIAKTLDRPIIEGDGIIETIHTTLIDDEFEVYLKDIQHSPCILQELIERDYEVRINVIGSQIFGTGLDMSHIPEAAVDSRLVGDYHDINHSVIDIPQEICSVSHDLCNYLDIKFGALDFIVNKNGDWFFLEVNPYGQWAWIEEMTGQPLSKAMAEEIFLCI